MEQRNEREARVQQVRGVIDRLEREGTVIAAADGGAHSIFPVAVSATDGAERSAACGGSAVAQPPRAGGSVGRDVLPLLVAGARCNPMSIPAETPAAVTIRPSRTTRRCIGRPPYARNCRSLYQWVVARTPQSSPAALNTSAPVQTEVVKRVRGWTPRSQSSAAWSARSPGVAHRLRTPPQP